MSAPTPDDPGSRIERAADALQRCDPEVRKIVQRLLRNEDLRRSGRLGLEFLGLVIGAGIAFFGLYWSYDLIRSGSAVSAVGGTALGTADLVAMVSTFVYGTRSRRQSQEGD